MKSLTESINKSLNEGLIKKFINKKLKELIRMELDTERAFDKKLETDFDNKAQRKAALMNLDSPNHTEYYNDFLSDIMKQLDREYKYSEKKIDLYVDDILNKIDELVDAELDKF